MSNFADIFTKYKAVVFFDTETTGLNANNCRIIELAAIRIEQNSLGSLSVTNSLGVLIKLPEGQKVPEHIVDLTGIADEQLEAEGISEAAAAARFIELIRDDRGPVLLVAHNAQFDLCFVREMLWRHIGDGEELFEAADYLDSLTVYKDRRDFPHKLENAITAYHLESKVQNTHRAIDDVKALFELCRAMDNERADLLEYVNTFGYNPKYGVSGRRLDGVTYWPQRSNKHMQPPGDILPALIQRRRKCAKIW